MPEYDDRGAARRIRKRELIAAGPKESCSTGIIGLRGGGIPGQVAGNLCGAGINPPRFKVN
jgi:hypothetical protein